MRMIKWLLLVLFLLSIFVHLNINFLSVDLGVGAESKPELNDFTKNCNSEVQKSHIGFGETLNAQGTICFNCENGEENPVVCYATFSSCGWGDSCSTFYRCNPNGDCYSTSGKDMIDSSNC